MTENNPNYQSETDEALQMLGAGYDQPAAIIDPPRNVKAVSDAGLVDYKVWGWVKTSAKFRAHIKILRGAKHDIWHYLALGVDENGKCKETIKQICEGTGYSHTEVINSLRELDELGYLSIQKDSRGNVYTIEFVARGSKNPSNEAVKKVESTPVYQVESTPPIEKSHPIPLELKELIPADAVSEIIEQADKSVDAMLGFEKLAKEAEQNGKAWRGRELLAPEHLQYGDWWHSKTGLHMYGAKAKPKIDTGWYKAFKELYENEVTIDSLNAAWDATEWRHPLSSPMQIVNEAKAIQSLPKQNAETKPEGKGFYA